MTTSLRKSITLGIIHLNTNYVNTKFVSSVFLNFSSFCLEEQLTDYCIILFAFYAVIISDKGTMLEKFMFRIAI